MIYANQENGISIEFYIHQSFSLAHIPILLNYTVTSSCHDFIIYYIAIRMLYTVNECCYLTGIQHRGTYVICMYTSRVQWLWPHNVFNVYRHHRGVLVELNRYALLILHFAELMNASNKMWHLMSCELRSSGSCRCRF